MEATLSENFYDSPTDQSIAKATIVSKYFSQWANVMIKTVDRGKPIAYVDLFAGPGIYNDGSKSTPLLVIDEALKHDQIAEQLVLVFNDKEAKYVETLKETIESYKGIERIKNDRRYWNDEVGHEIVSKFRHPNVPPTLLFVDPWGFKGLSLDLVNSVLVHFGCDVIFFFNYNRINMRLERTESVDDMIALFGKQREHHLRSRIADLEPHERELEVIEQISQALKGGGPGDVRRYVLPFRFRMAGGKKTSHHLFFVSKHFLGYDIMKKIMAQQSSELDQGLASFEYNPATHRQQLLLSLNTPFDDLEDMLLSDFAGRTAKRREIYEEHSVDTPFMERHYGQALWNLFERKAINANPPPKKRNTFAPHIVATFPPKSPR